MKYEISIKSFYIFEPFLDIKQLDILEQAPEATQWTIKDVIENVEIVKNDTGNANLMG